MKISKMTDQQALDKFLEFLGTRISITTAFVNPKDDGILTHQFLRIRCGELDVVSAPEALEVPLKIVTAQELGATVN